MSELSATTRPGATERSKTQRSGGRYHVLWVFPEERLTPLTGSLTLGRSAECGARLPGQEISRGHATITLLGGTPILRDNESRNGTFRNGSRIDETPLEEQDVVKLGEWVGVVLRLSDRHAGPVLREPQAGLLCGQGLGEAYDILQKAAHSDLPIVLEGETGTGKERFARALHTLSERGGPFVAVNCAALPESIAEAELFGFRKGAFTGADHASEGYLRAASGGTLLLDEITDLPAPTQAKLLRALEERCVTPLGQTTAVAIDVRVVSAGQESLTDAVQRGRLRRDLHARIAGLVVEIPPLRKRREEICRLLAQNLGTRLQSPPKLTASLVHQACIYDWPSNARELVNEAHRLAVLYGEEPELRPKHLAAQIRANRTVAETKDTPSDAAACAQPQSGSSRRYSWLQRNRDTMAALARAMNEHRGNVSLAAEAVGISRQKAYRLLRAAAESKRGGMSE